MRTGRRCGLDFTPKDLDAPHILKEQMSSPLFVPTSISVNYSSTIKLLRMIENRISYYKHKYTNLKAPRMCSVFLPSDCHPTVTFEKLRHHRTNKFEGNNAPRQLCSISPFSVMNRTPQSLLKLKATCFPAHLLPEKTTNLGTLPALAS